MMHSRPSRCLVFVLVGLASCGGEEPSGDGEAIAAQELHARSLNTRGLNTRALNGRILASRGLVGVTSNGRTASGSSFAGLQMIGRYVTDGTNRGSALVGSAVDMATTDGTTVRLRIDAFQARTWVDYYRVSYYDPPVFTLSGSYTPGSWRPLCTDAAGNADWAIAIGGRWTDPELEPSGSNPGGRVPGSVSWVRRTTMIGTYEYQYDSYETSHLTFACRPSALAKCVEPPVVSSTSPMRGYRFWLSRELDALHQTCVRAVRADFLGSGYACTMDETPFEIEDIDGINERDPSLEVDGYSSSPYRVFFEAEWNTSGAGCVGATSRIKDLHCKDRNGTEKHIEEWLGTAVERCPRDDAERWVYGLRRCTPFARLYLGCEDSLIVTHRL